MLWPRAQQEAFLPETEICGVAAAAKILNAAGFIDLSGDALTEGLKKRLFGIGVNSEDRAYEMLRLTQIVDSEVFWKVFHHCWSSCDDTWALNRALIQCLSFHNAEDPARSYMDREQAKFYTALPDVITVFRGCSKERIRGVSWTTDVAVAEGFARGHRGITPPNPIVARARIPSSEIFTVLLDREESEIVLNPSELIGLKSLKFNNR
jgi:hypothetical protein